MEEWNDGREEQGERNKEKGKRFEGEKCCGAAVVEFIGLRAFVEFFDEQ